MRKKLLLDENLPNPLKNDFSGEFEVATVHDQGWTSLKNGHLLAAMTEAGFDYLLTVDKNLRHQQNLEKYPIKLVLIRSFDNRYKRMKNLVPIIEEALKNMLAEAKVMEIDLKGE